MVFEYGAVSSKFSVEADNKLTAYVVMCVHYDQQANIIALYEPKEIVKNDSWMSFNGEISERLDEIFKSSGGVTFDEYIKSNVPQIKAAYATIKRLV